MSSPPKNLNDTAWEQLFTKYDILKQIDVHGRFEISAEQIREFREPRLMAKFDHETNLPEIFFKNKLEDFLQDEEITPTVSGRMSSGAFSFKIANSKSNEYCSVQVNNSQIEIDAAYEGVRGLAY